VSTSTAAAVLALALAGPSLAMDPGPSDSLVETPEFTIRLPAGARRSEEPSSSGPQLVSWMAVTARGTFGLLYADFPTDLTALDTRRLLDGARDAMLARVEGTPLAERDVSCDLDGVRRWPGRELEARTGAGAGVAVRICLVGARLYQLVAVSPAGPEVPAEFGPMVASFRLRPAAKRG
jgi:hypothetical protein